MGLRPPDLRGMAGAGGRGGRPFFDATVLRFGKDLRGIPQVVLQLVRLLATDSRFAAVHFVATEEVFRDHLAPLGIGRERVRMVRSLPGPLGVERFHGLFSTRRYRPLAREATLLIHPEPRTVTRLRVPQAVIHYDFIIFEDPAIGGRRKWSRWLWFWYKCRQAAKAPYQAAISGHTRRRALELFPGPPGRREIAVLHLGARSRLPGDAGPKAAPAGEVRFLYVGSYEARKNIDALLGSLPAVLGGLRAELHLAGHANASRRRDLEERIAAAGAGDRVRLHGLVTDETLDSLYRGCHFLLFPSLFEGFGLPLVEAMRYGMVVCAFDNSCIAEVAGDAAVLAPDNDFAAWGRRIAELVARPDLYADLSGRARARAGRFTEEAMLARYGDWLAGVLAETGVP